MKTEVLVVIALIIVMTLLTASGACNVSDRDLARLMRQEAITDYRNDGPVYFGCGEDVFGTHFSGIKNGQKVKGSVCGGWMKDYTVRYE